jgi:hypothetical protein
MTEAKSIHGIISKGNNFRVKVGLMKDKEGGHFFFVETRRLIDFKTRNITVTQNVYSVETFSVLAHISNFFIEHPRIKNKVLLKELSKIIPAKTSTDLNIK